MKYENTFKGSRWDRYLGMTAAMTQVPVPTATKMEQAIRYAAILLDAADDRQEEFDELLIERNRKGHCWVHFAVRPPKEGSRRKTMFIQT